MSARTPTPQKTSASELRQLRERVAMLEHQNQLLMVSALRGGIPYSETRYRVMYQIPDGIRMRRGQGVGGVEVKNLSSAMYTVTHLNEPKLDDRFSRQELKVHPGGFYLVEGGQLEWDTTPLSETPDPLPECPTYEPRTDGGWGAR